MNLDRWRLMALSLAGVPVPAWPEWTRAPWVHVCPDPRDDAPDGPPSAPDGPRVPVPAPARENVPAPHLRGFRGTRAELPAWPARRGARASGG